MGASFCKNDKGMVSPEKQNLQDQNNNQKSTFFMLKIDSSLSNNHDPHPETIKDDQQNKHDTINDNKKISDDNCNINDDHTTELGDESLVTQKIQVYSKILDPNIKESSTKETEEAKEKARLAQLEEEKSVKEKAEAKEKARLTQIEQEKARIEQIEEENSAKEKARIAQFEEEKARIAQINKENDAKKKARIEKIFFTIISKEQLKLKKNMQDNKKPLQKTKPEQKKLKKKKILKKKPTQKKKPEQNNLSPINLKFLQRIVKKV